MKPSLGTRFWLVVLRVCIGWHLLAAGLEKIHSVNLGKTETNRPWSGKGYLQEATGPLAPYFKAIAGDPDQRALTLLQPPTPPTPDKLPQPLAGEWDAYFDAFTAHYHLPPAEREKAKQVFDAAKADAARWYAHWVATADVTITRAFPFGTINVTKKLAEHVADYQAKLAEYQRAATSENPRFGQDVLKSRLKDLRAEVVKLRTDLLKPIDEQTAAMKAALQALVPEEQRALPPPADPPSWLLWFSDFSVRWGLTLCGAGLILGLFARLAATGGALLLLMFYLAAPPFPGMPETPKTEIYEIVVNKVLIEILALAVLATLPTGRWAGLDGMVAWFTPRKARPTEGT